MAINLFGFTIDRQKKPDLTNQSIVAPVPDDGSITASSAGYYGTYVDIDASTRSEAELIQRYREIAAYPDCDNAIEEIISEGIAAVENEPVVTVNLEKLKFSKSLKDTIQNEFNTILKLLDFKDKAHDIFRRWYIDGRVYYQKMIDPKDTTTGIQELRYIDPRKIKKVRQVKKEKQPNGLELIKKIDEFYIYNEHGISYSPGIPPPSGAAGAGIKIAPDTIAFCPSGIMDLNRNLVVGYLHKAIKPVNQLKMMADSLVIYRIARAPERRIFYIDVGNLPKVKAEQYLKEVMSRYRNKLVYDANTGEVRDDRKFMSMMEDFWLPRREGGRGTEISTLPGGQNLGELTDIEYFQKKLYRALGVPESRIASDGGFNLGRSSEILRDELKFSKFVGRLRKRFGNMFNDMLRTQLILKNIVTPEDWEKMSDHIQYDFLYDNQFAELKESEMMNERLGLAATVEPYLGKYYSTEYLRKKVLRQSDTEIEEIDAQIEQEIKDGILPDPSAVDPITGEPIAGGDLGDVPVEDDLEGQAAVTDAELANDTKKAEI